MGTAGPALRVSGTTMRTWAFRGDLAADTDQRVPRAEPGSQVKAQ